MRLNPGREPLRQLLISPTLLLTRLLHRSTQKLIVGAVKVVTPPAVKMSSVTH